MRRSFNRGPADNPFEEFEQRDLAVYLDMKFGSHKWFHVPNGGMRNKAEGGKLKAQGAKKGVPDNFIIVPSKKHPDSKGTVIELKRIKGGTVSPDQKLWIESLEEEGWIVFVAKGCGQAIDIIEKLY